MLNCERVSVICQSECKDLNVQFQFMLGIDQICLTTPTIDQDIPRTISSVDSCLFLCLPRDLRCQHHLNCRVCLLCHHTFQMILNSFQIERECQVIPYIFDANPAPWLKKLARVASAAFLLFMSIVSEIIVFLYGII